MTDLLDDDEDLSGDLAHDTRNARTEDETMDDASFDASPDVLTVSAQGRLRSFVERLERLEEDKAAVLTDMKEVRAEAKGEGYDTKILNRVIRIRKQDRAKRQEEEAILDLYLSALGEI
jgi:uncharacterized protein (UPF0335 family)